MLDKMAANHVQQDITVTLAHLARSVIHLFTLVLLATTARMVHSLPRSSRVRLGRSTIVLGPRLWPNAFLARQATTAALTRCLSQRANVKPGISVSVPPIYPVLQMVCQVTFVPSELTVLWVWRCGCRALWDHTQLCLAVLRWAIVSFAKLGNIVLLVDLLMTVMPDMYV